MAEIEGAIVRQVSGPCATISLNGISIFTFSNQVLTPDIYGAHWLGQGMQTVWSTLVYLCTYYHYNYN